MNILNLSPIKNDIVNLESVCFDYVKIASKLKKLKPHSAPGPDQINTRLLIETADTVCVPLEHIFKLSMSESLIPLDWKRANVTPIFKKGSKFDCGNYRPVSLTSVICKTMESLIRDEIVNHLSVNN